MIALDVCDDNSVMACLRAILDQTGHLDVLVNSAGFAVVGALEELSIGEAMAQFETNFFGIVRMVKAVLPVMRQQERGKIINMSSLAGLTSVPFLGMYSASKFALEGYTEALRLEVSPFNIQVSQIEAGFLNSSLMEHRQDAMERIRPYDPWRQQALASFHDHIEKGPLPGFVAETVLKIVASESPRLRYVIGKQAKQTSRLRWLLPERVFEKGTRATFRLDAGR